MSTNTTKQAGFSMVVAIIIAVLAIGVLGYGGYRLYSHFNKPASTVATSSSQTSDTSIQPMVSYLDIKELGIKIKLSDSVKDATYSVKTNQATSSVVYAFVSTKSLEGQSAACSTDSAPLGSITKATGNLKDLFGASADSLKTTKLGDSYFFITSPQASCSENSSIQSLANQQRAIFSDDFKTVQLDN